jgi:staphylococcal nuclease domain-containing protein 1
MLGAEMAALRKSESIAQEGKLGLHKGHVAKTGGAASDVIVSKVFSADTIFVRSKSDGGAEKRISFSSLRGPRKNEASEAPFQDEAKEFLRKKLIGKHVRISVDGTKAANEGYEAKEVATVLSGDKNIGKLQSFSITGRTQI